MEFCLVQWFAVCITHWLLSQDSGSVLNQFSAWHIPGSNIPPSLDQHVQSCSGMYMYMASCGVAINMCVCGILFVVHYEALF